MAEILNAKKVADNGLLSKIQIGGKTYEIKDLIAREEVIKLWAAQEGLAGKIGNVAEGQNLADIIKNIQENAYDDTELRGLITALENNKADKTQVAKDIADAVAAEATLREAAEEALDVRLDKVETFFAVAEGEKLDEALDTLKEIQAYVDTHGDAADAMVKDIAANKAAIEAEVKARDDADKAIDERLDAIEAELGDGEGSVAEQIEAAKQAAITAAKTYTDEEDAKVEAEVAKKEDKANLKALAYKDAASGTVAGQTITGVKANGQSAGSITVELAETERATSAAGKYTPVGNVTGTVQTAGSIAVTAKYADADAALTKGDYTPAGTVSADFTHAATAASLTKGDYTPAGEVSVALSGGSFNAITSVGTAASFTEGEFTPASLTYTEVEKNVAKEGLVGTVNDDECLVFTAAGLEAISASKVTAFNGGSKAADTFVANTPASMEAHNVGVQSSTFTGTKAEDLVVTGVSYDKASLANLAFAGTKAEGALVTGVSYKKADIDQATFTGAEVDITAKFAGTEGDITVAGKCKDYAVKTAQFNPAAIELTVGDIAVAEKTVTVQ